MRDWTLENGRDGKRWIWIVKVSRPKVEFKHIILGAQSMFEDPFKQTALTLMSILLT